MSDRMVSKTFASLQLVVPIAEKWICMVEINF